MTAYIDIIGTEPFWVEYSEQDNHDKMRDIEAFLRDVWDTYVNRDVSINYYDGTYVPESALTDDPLAYRTDQIDTWADNNWDIYDSSDTIVGIDYFTSSNVYGYSPEIGGAGDSTDITVGVNSYFEDTNNLDYYIQNVKTEGICYHELCHMWDAKHKRASIDSLDQMSLIYSPANKAECIESSGTDQTIKWQSDCCKERVQEYYGDYDGTRW